MTTRRILQATEPRSETILRRKSNKVRRFDQDLQGLVDDMVETMRASKGVGLAAPQVGVLQRVIVAELFEGEESAEGEEAPPATPSRLYPMCNPEITWQSEEQQVGEEGCLSLANWYGEVARAQGVEVRYQDLQGRRQKVRVEGFLARILQHEIDHLDGVLFTDRVEDLSTLVRLTEEGAEPIQVQAIPAAKGRPVPPLS